MLRMRSNACVALYNVAGDRVKGLTLQVSDTATRKKDQAQEEKENPVAYLRC